MRLPRLLRVAVLALACSGGSVRAEELLHELLEHLPPYAQVCHPFFLPVLPV